MNTLGEPSAPDTTSDTSGLELLYYTSAMGIIDCLLDQMKSIPTRYRYLKPILFRMRGELVAAGQDTHNGPDERLRILNEATIFMKKERRDSFFSSLSRCHLLGLFGGAVEFDRITFIRIHQNLIHDGDVERDHCRVVRGRGIFLLEPDHEHQSGDRYFVVVDNKKPIGEYHEGGYPTLLPLKQTSILYLSQRVAACIFGIILGISGVGLYTAHNYFNAPEAPEHPFTVGQVIQSAENMNCIYTITHILPDGYIECARMTDLVGKVLPAEEWKIIEPVHWRDIEHFLVLDPDLTNQ